MINHNFISKHKLNNDELNLIHELYAIYENYYSTTIDFLSNDIPSIPKEFSGDIVPIYFFLYNSDNTLIAFSYMYYISDNEINFYSIHIPNLPECLYIKFIKNIFYCNDFLKKHKNSLIFPMLCSDNLLISTYNKLNINYHHTEYILINNLSLYNACIHNHDSVNIESIDIEYEENEYGDELSLWLEDNYIGGCLISSQKDTACIYEFGICDEYQGKGLGKFGLVLICNILKEMHYNKAILQVTSENKKAVGLYLNHGFEVMSKEDIYMFS